MTDGPPPDICIRHKVEQYLGLQDGKDAFSTEAEYISMVSAFQECILLQRLQRELTQ